ncbi:hypothetical protein D3C78_1107650 [compost metagenome]
MSRHQLRDQRQLGRNGLAGAIELQGLGIGLAGHACIQVAQILMGRRIAGVGANRLLQRFRRLALLPVCRIEHGQIVIGLGHARIVPDQRRKNLDRLGIEFLLGGNHALHEAHFHIAGILLEVAIRLLGCLLGIALLQQLSHLIHAGRRMRGQYAQGHPPTGEHSEQGSRKTRGHRTARTQHNFGCNQHMALFSKR